MNVHSLFSNRNESDDSDDNNNNRYVGGVSSRGGGSGLAVEPNTSDQPDSNSILSAIRANAEEAGNTGTGGGAASAPPRRTITMYRSSFTVDNGPERRLDDPSNAEFLKDLARGIVPRELQEDRDGSDGESGSGSGSGGETTVGLIDKRQMEYADDAAARSASGGGGGAGGAGSSQPSSFSSFTGEGQSLGTSSTTATGGVITPSTTTNEQPPPLDESSPKTMIQVRLLNGKRLRITINKSSTIATLVQHVNVSGDAGTDPYVLSAGFPPKILDDLNRTIEECGLAGSQVIQKKA